MHTYTNKKIKFEAKENTSPSFKIRVPHKLDMSCGCTAIESPNDEFIIAIETLPEVRYMVADISAIDHYTKSVTVTINGEPFQISIKVTT